MEIKECISEKKLTAILIKEWTKTMVQIKENCEKNFQKPLKIKIKKRGDFFDHHPTLSLIEGHKLFFQKNKLFVVCILSLSNKESCGFNIGSECDLYNFSIRNIIKKEIEKYIERTGMRVILRDQSIE